jgi:ribosomal protein S18 acetylase RimI-like enzyme
MTDITTREMKREDIASAAEIQKNILSAEGARSLRYEIEELLGSYLEKSPGTCLVATLDETVIGFMVGDIKEWSFGVERAGWIEIIGVEPQFMGQGVGKVLGKALIELFKKEGIENIYTSVRWNSGDLISFFQSLGFDKSSFINLRLMDDSD